jgi:hypothetical protein
MSEEIISKILEETFPGIGGVTIEKIEKVALEDMSLLYLGGPATSHLVMLTGESQVALGTIVEDAETFTFYPVCPATDIEELASATITAPKFEGWRECMLKVLKFGLLVKMLADAKEEAAKAFREKDIDPETDPIAQEFFQEMEGALGREMDLRNFGQKFGGMKNG